MPHRFKVIEEDCIGCGLCSERAPDNLEVPAGSTTAQVFKQPETSAEEEACLEARDYCPIGGLHAIAAASPPAEESASGPRPTSIPVGDPTPVDVTRTRLEN